MSLLHNIGQLVDLILQYQEIPLVATAYDFIHLLPGNGLVCSAVEKLAKAGVETWHAGSIGEDGRFLLKQMEDAGVNTECVSILTDIRTGNAIMTSSIILSEHFLRSNSCIAELHPHISSC